MSAEKSIPALPTMTQTPARPVKTQSHPRRLTFSRSSSTESAVTSTGATQATAEKSRKGITLKAIKPNSVMPRSKPERSSCSAGRRVCMRLGSRKARKAATRTRCTKKRAKAISAGGVVASNIRAVESWQTNSSVATSIQRMPARIALRGKIAGNWAAAEAEWVIFAGFRAIRTSRRLLAYSLSRACPRLAARAARAGG